MIADQGPMAISVMWVLLFICTLFVVLRLYTRIFIVRAVGLDDYVYVFAWVLLFLYVVFLTISATYGFGQDIDKLTIDNAVKAVKIEFIGQTFAILGMAVAKVSLGIFLNRIVVQRWHKVAIHIAMISLLAVSILTDVMLWVQRTPVQSLWDPRVPSHEVVSIAPFSILLGVWCAAVDFFFAGFPWVFIWGLQMNKKDKILLASSMSLGVISGVCGIVRTIELGGLVSANYTKATVNLIVWSAAELVVTMVCIGVPVCRPLYKRVFKRYTSSGGYGSGPYSKQNGTGDHMPEYRVNIKKRNNINPNATQDDEDYNAIVLGESKWGNKGSTTTYVTRDNQSDEEILGPEFRQNNSPQRNGIMVKKDVHVKSGAMA